MVQHEARLATTGEDGVTRRSHLEVAASRGNAKAIAALEGPPYPEPLRYLHGWAMELVGRSGADMNGLAPISYGTIADWARLTGRAPAPHEIRALLRLDAAMRRPDPEEG